MRVCNPTCMLWRGILNDEQELPLFSLYKWDNILQMTYLSSSLWGNRVEIDAESWNKLEKW